MKETPADRVLSIVLAGDATRLGPLGALLPKALFPVSATETLLSRTLDHLREAGFSSLVVSTSPAGFALIKPFVDRYCKSSGAGNNSRSCEVVTLENPQHRFGPLHALAEVLRRFAAEQYLLCLGDIFFTCNPFSKVHKANGGGNYLLVWPMPDEERLAQGGIAFLQGGYVSSLSYESVARNGCARGVPASWTGSALFQQAVKEDLSAHLSANGGQVLEHFFNYSLSQGRSYQAIEAGEFVNVNRFPDLQRVLSVDGPRLAAGSPCAVPRESIMKRQ